MNPFYFRILRRQLQDDNINYQEHLQNIYNARFANGQENHGGWATIGPRERAVYMNQLFNGLIGASFDELRNEILANRGAGMLVGVDLPNFRISVLHDLDGTTNLEYQIYSPIFEGRNWLRDLDFDTITWISSNNVEVPLMINTRIEEIVPERR